MLFTDRKWLNKLSTFVNNDADMNSMELKDKLIQHINTTDEQSLKELYDFAMQKTEKEELDPFDELPEIVQQLLHQSIENSEKGNIRPHEEIMAEIKKKHQLSD